MIVREFIVSMAVQLSIAREDQDCHWGFRMKRHRSPDEKELGTALTNILRTFERRYGYGFMNEPLTIATIKLFRRRMERLMYQRQWKQLNSAGEYRHIEKALEEWTEILTDEINSIQAESPLA